MKLELQPYSLGKKKAIEMLNNMLLDLNVSIPSNVHLYDSIVTINGTEEIALSEEIEHIRKNGKANKIQLIYDQNDMFSNNFHSIGYTSNIPGLSTNIQGKIGDFEINISDPGLLDTPEKWLQSDITTYRKQFVDSWNSGDPYSSTRYFRGYLLASISFIECILYQYVFFLSLKIDDLDQYQNINILKSRDSIENKLSAWLDTFAIHKKSSIIQSSEWSHMKIIKNARNRIVHPDKPIASYNIKSMVQILNAGKKGIGGLLIKMRKAAQQKEFVSILQVIKNMPEIVIKK